MGTVEILTDDDCRAAITEMNALKNAVENLENRESMIRYELENFQDELTNVVDRWTALQKESESVAIELGLSRTEYQRLKLLVDTYIEACRDESN